MSNTIAYKLYTLSDPLTTKEIERVTAFLFHHLDQYGDKAEDIQKAIHYAMKVDDYGQGGYVVTATEGNEMKGAVVVNKTGMDGYIPENILVYIAVHQDTRGKGVGKSLMEMALKCADGDVALHVEPDNPAKKLYEKLGFTNKYLEMRYTK